MGKHMKTMAAPRSWPVPRKNSKYILKPKPGPNSLETSLPLGVILRDLLAYTQNSRETKQVLSSGKVLVNDVTRAEIAFPVGILDVLSIPDMKKRFTLLFNLKGKLMLLELKQDDYSHKIHKI